MAKVEIPNLPSNSSINKDGGKTKKPKISPIISKNSLVSTNKNLFERFIDAWFDVGDDDSILRDVIIPAIKNTILESLNMMFFHGEKGSYGKNGNYYYTSYDDYGKKKSSYTYRKSGYDRPKPEDSSKVNPRNIVIRERIEAERVVDDLRNRIEEYRSASVADLLELVGLTSNFVDNDWGWDDPRSVGLRKVSNGWLIAVDEPKYISD